jgi:DNA-binding MarR family transcriptional regulator
MHTISNGRPVRTDTAFSDNELTALMNALRRLSIAVRQSEARSGRAATTAGNRPSAADRLLLRELANEEELSISELARRVRVDRSGISVAVARLDACGLVVRGISRSDRRKAAVALTPLGRAALEDGSLPHTLSLAVLERCSRAELDALAGSLTRLARALAKTAKMSAA